MTLNPLWSQPYALTALLTGFLAGLMAIVPMWKGPRSRVARLWALMCGCVAGWALLNTVSLLSPTAAGSLAYLRMADAVAVFIPITFLHFAMRFADRRHPAMLRVGYAVSALVASTAGTPWFVRAGQQKFGIWFEKGGPAFLLFAGLYVLLAGYGIRLLLRAARTSAGTRKAQLTCLALATAVGFGGGFMWFLPAFDVDIPPLGGHVVAVYCIIAMYAIVRYQFLDIRIVIRKSVVYSALVTLLTFAYFTVAFVGERYFQGTVGYRSLALSVVVFTGMALAFQPLKRWLQRRVDRWLLPEPREALARRLEFLEEEVREADKARAVGRLAAGIAHEIKNPLAAIRTFVNLLPMRQREPQFMAEFQQVVGGELERLRELAEGLVDFSKPQRSQRTATQITEVLHEVLTLVGGELRQQAITVETADAADGARVLGDAAQLKQAFLNLILNARDAMPAGGRLTVATRLSDGAVEVALADTGQGIAPADLPRLFEPFFTRKPDGHGLGLSIVQGIIREHGGTISVQSTPGRGTTFTVRLPQAAPEPALPGH